MSVDDERKLVRRIRFHNEFRATLEALSLTADLSSFDQQVDEVMRCWFNLGREHLDDARHAEADSRSRSVYSRSYYAVYNASKAVRYRVKGSVSLKSDDHKKAVELPDDFPNLDSWIERIAEMYSHRLRADYDNWTLSSQENSLSMADCISYSEEFLQDCEQYIQSKYGVSL